MQRCTKDLHIIPTLLIPQGIRVDFRASEEETFVTHGADGRREGLRTKIKTPIVEIFQFELREKLATVTKLYTSNEEEKSVLMRRSIITLECLFV